MLPMLNTAVRAARRAGDLILRSLDAGPKLTIESKGRNDFVTEVDKRVELEIIQMIQTTYPDHSFLAEESGRHEGNECVWIIDPIDGTNNFIHGIPHFAVSIALEVKGRTEVGVIYDPVRQELFTALRGSGAKLNDRRLRVSDKIRLSDAMLGTGFPFRKDQPMDVYLDGFGRIAPLVAGIRRPGAATLDLAYVAAGRFDGFWEIGLQAWDMAAGVLMIREAGGLVGDFQGGNSYIESGNIVAGNPKIFKALLQTLHPGLPVGFK